MKRFSHVTIILLYIAKLFSDLHSETNISSVEQSVVENQMTARFISCALKFIDTAWQMIIRFRRNVRILTNVESNNHLLSLWSSHVITIIVRDQMSWHAERRKCVSDKEYASQRVLHVSWHVCIFSLMFKLNKILQRMQSCVDMHDWLYRMCIVVVLLQLQQNVYIIYIL